MSLVMCTLSLPKRCECSYNHVVVDCWLGNLFSNLPLGQVAGSRWGGGVWDTAVTTVGARYMLHMAGLDDWSWC